MKFSELRALASCCAVALLAACAAPGQNASPLPLSASVARAARPSSVTQPTFYVGATQDPGGLFTFSSSGATVDPTPGFGGIGFVDAITYDSHNRFLYILAQDAIHAYARDGAIQVLDGTFTGLDSASGLAYCAKNHLIYAINEGNSNVGSITVYDEYGVQQVAPKYRDVPEHPDAIACDPKTGSLYIASFEGGVTVYSVTGQKIKAPFANTQRPQGILVDTHDGLVYVSNGIGSPVITAYTTAGVQVQTTGDWAGTPNPYGLAFDAQTNLIYVTDFGTGRVTAYDEQGRRHKLTGFSGMTPALGIGPIAIIE